MSRHSGTREASRLQRPAGGPERRPGACRRCASRTSRWTTCCRCWSAPVRAGRCPRTTRWWDSSVPPAAANPPSSMRSAALKSRRRQPAGPPRRNRWRASGERTAAKPLLDWLDVQQAAPCARRAGIRRRIQRADPAGPARFRFDRAANREIVQRMVGMVDVLVWVLDPQKYADAAVHNDFLAPLASHGAVTLVVLNQIDRLPAADVRPCMESLKGILARDGLGKVQVSAASALTGAGVDKVRAAIRQVVAQREACPSGCRRMYPRRPGSWWTASGPRRARRRKGGTAARLAEELARAANVPLVVDAVARSYRHESTRRTGWPVTRWLVRFRPDPLRRLNLRRDVAMPRSTGHRCRPPERRSGPGPMLPCGNSRTPPATGAPGPGGRPSAARPAKGREQLPDALDQAIAGTDLKAGRKSWWWAVFNVVQWLALLTAVGGLALAGRAGRPRLPAASGSGGAPGGRLAGSHAHDCRGSGAGHSPRDHREVHCGRRCTACGRRRRGSGSSAAVAAVAGKLVVEPVEVEISRLKSFNAAVKAAAAA